MSPKKWWCLGALNSNSSRISHSHQQSYYSYYTTLGHYATLYYNTLTQSPPNNRGMAAGLVQSPRLSLTIDGGTESNGIGNMAATWSPSDALHGRLEISSLTSFQLDEASVFLEGISGNWVGDLADNQIILKISNVERKFLSQTFDIPLSLVDPATTVSSGFHLAIPFHFIISSTLAGSSPGSPLHCLQLPPSIELGKVYIDESSKKRFAQPSITYQIRALATFSAEGQDQAPSVETYIPILIMPHTEELPPTDTKDFPAEFKLQESRAIRWSSFGRSFGAMTVSMQEPRALTYNMSSTGAATEGFLNLEVEPTGTGNTYQYLQAMSLTVLSLIRIKTFYSIKAFPQLPSQSLLTVHGGTRLRDDMIKLETRNIPSVSWGYTYDLAEDATLEEATKPWSKAPVSPSSSDSRRPRGKWTAKISHSICVDSRLLPTFCSSIVARLYSVILRVKVAGIKKELFDLEVPLQVVHTSPDIQLTEAMQYSAATTGPVGENPSLLEFRRASATSWFSNESLRLLENEELPPRYHP